MINIRKIHKFKISVCWVKGTVGELGEPEFELGKRKELLLHIIEIGYNG